MSDGFDLNTLSASLDSEERRRLLESIRAAGKTDEAPVIDETEPQIEALEEQYRKLGFLDRLRLMLTQMFSGRSRIEVLTRWTTQALAVQVQQCAGDGLDTKGRRFLDPFAEAIARLATALGKVSNYLRVATNRRTDLVLRLVESVAPSLHRQLIDATSASEILRQDTTNEHELRKRLAAHLEGAMTELGTSEQRCVRRALMQADTLRRLGDFGLNSILASFNGDASDHSRECAFDHVVRPIGRLAAEFAGLHQAIDPLLIETLVLLEEESRATGDRSASPQEFSDAVTAGVQKIQAVIALLRRIGKRYPLLSIARLIHNDPWWTPGEIASTDDWRALYRGAFTERIQRHVRSVSLRRQISEQFKVLVGIGATRPMPIPGLDALGIRGFLRATALHLFVHRVYAPSLDVLRQILNEGDFYKDSNRAQYNDTFNELERLAGMVASLVKDVAPGSNRAQALTGARGDEARVEVTRELHKEIDAMIKHAKTMIELLVNLLGGILYATAGSTYDTLANLGRIGGGRNSEFVEEAQSVHTRIERFARVLNELMRIERSAEDHNVEIDPSILDELI